jgi:hypothetical protein
MLPMVAARSWRFVSELAAAETHHPQCSTGGYDDSSLVHIRRTTQCLPAALPRTMNNSAHREGPPLARSSHDVPIWGIT